MKGISQRQFAKLDGCTPKTVRDRIGSGHLTVFEDGSLDQRHYYVPCPHCDLMQVLRFRNMEWHKEYDADDPTKVIKHHPKTAFFWCKGDNEDGCGCAIEEHHKLDMVERGEWRAHAQFNGHAGYHIWTA